MIWELIDKMRQEMSVDIAKIELNDIGLTSKRKENTLEHRLQILCQRSADNEPVDVILQNISHCLRKRSREYSNDNGKLHVTIDLYVPIILK
ncbi:hypothetical protein ACI65C_012450 [Semiaphis heraclei]